jgi:hypothetical protein
MRKRDVGAGGALAVVLVWIAGLVNLEMSAEVGAAMATLLTTFLAPLYAALMAKLTSDGAEL